MIYSSNHKGQTSVEFIIIFAILFFVFVFGTYISLQKNSIIYENEKSITYNSMAMNLGNIINQVYQTENGYEKQMQFNFNSNLDYFIFVSNFKLYISDLDTNALYDYPLHTNDVDFNTQNLQNIIISKQNNFVVIKNAE